MSRRMDRAGFSRIVLLCTMLCGACASETPVDVGNLGTETNWLRSCDSDADCGKFSCECGICTDPCATDSQCTVPGAHCRASDGPEASALCAAESLESAGVCLPTCTASCDADEICLGDRCEPRAVTSIDAEVPDVGTDAPDAPGVSCEGRSPLALNAIELSDGEAIERSTACYEGCGYVVEDTDEDGEKWIPNAEVSCPLLEEAACNTIREELFTTPQPCETDNDCELWNPLSCENVAGITNLPVSLLLSSEERSNQRISLDRFTNGGCGNALSTGLDGPIYEAACDENQCTTRQNSSCGLGPEPDGGTDNPDAGEDASTTADSGAGADAACTFDSCHPDRCDAVGEPCCDPLPSDGPNYCNNGLTCGANGCEAAGDGPACGATQCATDEVCCDRCASTCVSALSGANCAEDDRPDTFTCEGEGPAFYCGPSTVCSDATSQYCRIFQGGIEGPPSYDCLDLPAACAATPTCECTLQNIDDPGAQCAAGPNGELTVTPLPAP